MKKSQTDTGNRQISLRIPELLSGPLRKAAKAGKCTEQAVILAVLAKHFKVDLPAPARGRPPKAT